MAVEKARGCGYRKVGGIYLIGSGRGIACDRLPYRIKLCPCCGAGIKQQRSLAWLDALKFFKSKHQGCKDVLANSCPICNPKNEKYALLWVGDRYYTVENFVKEAHSMGISRRIPWVPNKRNKLVLGKTWVLLAHPSVVKGKNEKGEEELQPAIFYAFKPTRIEKLLTKSQATKSAVEKLKKQGVTVVVVPDNDRDHNPIKKRKRGK